MVKELNLETNRPISELCSGWLLNPRIMGSEPVKAIPKALKQAG